MRVPAGMLFQMGALRKNRVLAAASWRFHEARLPDWRVRISIHSDDKPAGPWLNSWMIARRVNEVLVFTKGLSRHRAPKRPEKAGLYFWIIFLALVAQRRRTIARDLDSRAVSHVTRRVSGYRDTW